MLNLKKILLAYSKKLFSDAHSVIMSIILTSLVVGTGTVYIFFEELWSSIIKYMQSPVPLWVTISLALLILCSLLIPALIVNRKNKSLQKEAPDSGMSWKKNYKMLSPWDSAIVYSLTKADCNGEPPHWLCTECFDKNKRSFLKPRHNEKGKEEFFCGKCGDIVPSNHRGYHKIKYFEEYV